ncbi:MAG TPA: AarF/ABC1/UbiB kinase family protein [Aeromicrobium sp.]|nr:AarF/ABC1/UbiB kinase family protein [Aeromicrobium sp.]
MAEPDPPPPEDTPPPSQPRRARSRPEPGSSLPVSALSRGFKLAALPVGFAGRTTLGVGKRLAGAPAEAVLLEVQRRTAEQLFTVLGQLKGGAMKFGQAMSIFEAALPDEIAKPYRETLTKLQDAAPPMPPSVVHRVMTREFGEGWRDQFPTFDDEPAAAASIGQVHRATWQSPAGGEPIEVAVKLQYPGAGKALRSDLRQLARLGRIFALIAPAVDVEGIIEELQARVVEELDYAQEASNQNAFADAFADDPDIVIPRAVTSTEHALVTTWLESTGSLADIIAKGTQQERDHFGKLYIHFLFTGPVRAGLLHADPHPGNYRVLPSGQLGVVDFGAVDRLPDGVPPELGRLIRVAADEDHDDLERELRELGFLRPNAHLSPEAIGRYVGPLVEPAQTEEFTFSREWIRSKVAHVSAPTADGMGTSLRINLPREYILLHRVGVGGVGVLCQLGATVRVPDVLAESLPGYAR